MNTTERWRMRGTAPRASNFDPYYYRIVEAWVGPPAPPGLLDKYDVICKVQGRSREQADERARLIAAAPALQSENAALRAALEACERLADHALSSSPESRREALGYIRTEARAALAQGRA